MRCRHAVACAVAVGRVILLLRESRNLVIQCCLSSPTSHSFDLEVCPL